MELPILLPKKDYDPHDPEPCAGCGHCCRYITVNIKAPRSRTDYDEIRWFLLHEHVSVFIDTDGWYVEFQTTCRHLDGHRCGAYATRPRVCSDYEVESCERYGEGEPYLHRFADERQYLDFLRRHRPHAYAWVTDPRPRESAERSARPGVRSVRSASRAGVPAQAEILTRTSRARQRNGSRRRQAEGSCAT